MTSHISTYCFCEQTVYFLISADHKSYQSQVKTDNTLRIIHGCREKVMLYLINYTLPIWTPVTTTFHYPQCTYFKSSCFLVRIKVYARPSSLLICLKRGGGTIPMLPFWQESPPFFPYKKYQGAVLQLIYLDNTN